MILDPANRPTWARYVVVVLTVALAAVVRAGPLGSLGTRAPYVTFYPAVILAALFGGLPAGLLATLLSVLAVFFWWVEPVGQFSILDPADMLSAGAFIFGGSMISFITQAMQRANQRAMDAEAQVRLVTERSRAEQELRRYKLLAEYSRDIIICVACDDRRILEANEAAVNAYGYTRQELLGLSIYDLRSADGHPLVDDQMAEADTHSVLFETVHRRKDHSTFPVEVSSQGATIGGTRTLISVIRDISNRKRAEAALRESESRLRALSDNLPEGVLYRYRMSVEGKPCFEFLSAGIERLTGIPAAEFLADARTLEKAIVPEDRERLRAAMALSRERLTQFEVEVRRRHRVTGEILWSLLRSTPRRNPDGSTTWDGIELDITDRKRAEEALRENREKLQAALGSMADAVFISDAEGRFVEFNDAFATFHRFQSKEDCARTLAEYPDILDVFLPDGARAPLAMWPVPRALAGEVATNAEYILRRKDTGKAWVGSYSFSPLRDKDGAIVGSVVVGRDISDRKRAEEALRDSERQFRTLANAIPQLCWMANADGWVFWYNERWYQYTGTSPEQMEGWGWQRVHDADMLPKVLERWKLSIATGEPFDMVFPMRGADGEFRPFLTRVMPLRDRDGKVARWFGTNTDISEQRRVEEALAASDRKLRALLDSASQGVVAVDESGRIVLVNAQTEEMFGYRREELLGQPMGVLLPERYRETHGEHLGRYFAHSRVRGMVPGVEFRGRSKSGNEFPLEISLSCIEQGGSRLALALITDITERQKAEERLRQAQKMESLGILAGGVAHDFNNLLVGVIGNASLAQEMIPPDHPVAELLDGVLRTGEQAAHLTRQMLAYSGKGHFVVEPLDLSALIPEIGALVRSSIARKISLTLDLDAGLPAIVADRGQIQQVFMNLALNAAEAIGSHDGTISVRTYGQDVDDEYLRLHAEAAALRAGRYVCLEVRDTGSGMDESTKARIFDPFFSTKFTGRGLGLAAVAGIVRGHKGAILVESAPGQGSCFTVLFPTDEQAVRKPAAVRTGAAAPGTGVVLMVDDEPAVREMAKRTLELQGYTVLQAGSARAAIEVLKRHTGPIALVVLDLSMPDMSGAEALPELRKLRPELKVVVSSGYSEAETMTLFEGQRVSGFLPKPYTSSGLAGKVNALLA